jgi:hypothetical protein
MMQKILKAVRGLTLLPANTRIFDPQVMFANKRVTIVGPAGSLFQEENGSFIDGFDYVVRINKAAYSLAIEKAKHQGTRTDILFHSFFENNETGGGPLDFNLYKSKGIRYVVNPRNNFAGWRVTFNFYKKYLRKETVYLLPAAFYANMIKPFRKPIRPTVGYTALYAALQSRCEEVFITGFTFFKTAYASGYRDHLLDTNKNMKHLKDHGIHDPDQEFELFLELIKRSPAKKIHFDKELTAIIASHSK